MLRGLRASIYDFFINGRWCVPMVFKTAFLDVAKCIEEVELFPRGDSLVWSSSVAGDLSFKDAYDASRSHGGDFKWGVSLW